MSYDLCFNWDTKIISQHNKCGVQDRQIQYQLIQSYLYTVLLFWEYNMTVIHHYGCHTPLNQIWSNIYIYMYFILIQIRQCSQTQGSSNRKVYLCNSNSHGWKLFFIKRQIVIVMECELMCNTGTLHGHYMTVHLVSKSGHASCSLQACLQLTGLGMYQFISTDQHQQVIMLYKSNNIKSLFYNRLTQPPHAHLLPVIKTVAPSPEITYLNITALWRGGGE